MKHVLLDTNVIVDYLLLRKGFYEDAEKIINAGFKKIITLYTSTHSIANIYYLLRQGNSHKKTIEKIQALSFWFQLLPVDEHVFQLALTSDFKDFEDALLNFSSVHQKQIKYLISRNEKDFKSSSLKIVSPKKYLALLKAS